MNDLNNYNRVEKALKFIAQNFKNQHTLGQISSHINVSPFHFQRIFAEWAGISPKKFLQYITLENLKKELTNHQNLIEAAENVGLSAQSRVYDLFVNIEAVTPDEYRKNGRGLVIEYGFHSTPFGECMIAVTERGICSLEFTNDNEDFLINELKNKWKQALVLRNQRATEKFEELIFGQKRDQGIKLYVQGTKFQVKVWEALLKIPFGAVTDYKSIANYIQNPDATRAVGSAIGKNPVAYLIPCHRVIRNEGIIGQYHWDSARKTAMIGWEKTKNIGM